MQVIIADDHKLIRDGISPFVKELDPNVDILEAASLSEVLNHIDNASNLGLILLDLIMPGMNAFYGLQEVTEKCPTVPVVVLSGYASRDHVISAMRHGASGFIPKSVAATTMVNALRLILNGEKYLPSSSFLNLTPDTDTTFAAPPSSQALMTRLTTRETEVMACIVRGQTNKDIANNLDVKEITIKVHLRNIYRKIGARNRSQAISLALTSGFDERSKQV